MMATGRQLGLVSMDTIEQADRCAALLTIRLGGRVSRIGAVRIAIAELEDKLVETAAQAAAGEGGGHG